MPKPKSPATLDTSAFDHQAHWCRNLGSDFTAQILEALIETLDGTTATGRKVLNWPGGSAGPLHDVVPLRLTGALHAMVLTKQAPALAALYPPNPAPAHETLVKTLRDTLQTCDAEITAYLVHAPQTNEIARSSVLIAGLSIITERAGLPIALSEIGTSGGLNLNLDRYAHALGTTAQLGDANSPVKLAPNWSGPVPTTQPIIASRIGCDINPMPVTDPASATRLLSYIWPDQPERFARTRAAIKIAQNHPPELVASDAADWLETHLKTAAPQNQTRVLMHSIAWQYMPKSVQSRITAAMETTAQSATRQSPLAWLSFELAASGQAHLTVRLWPHNGSPETLATADSHVKSVTWHA